VSLGVATVDYESLSIDELVHRADTALYEAKRAGRDRVVSARPAADPDTERRAS
jgi:PleD family two-component response regulator